MRVKPITLMFFLMPMKMKFKKQCVKSLDGQHIGHKMVKKSASSEEQSMSTPYWIARNERIKSSTQSTKREGCDLNTQRYVSNYSIAKQRGCGVSQVSRRSSKEEQKWNGNTGRNLFVINLKFNWLKTQKWRFYYDYTNWITRWKLWILYF